MDEAAGKLAAELDRLRVRVEQLKRIEKEKEILCRFASRVAGVGSATAVMEVFTEESDRLLGWDFCYLAYRQPESDLFRIVYYVDTVDGRKRIFPGEDQPEATFCEPIPQVLKGKSVVINRKCGDPSPQMVPAASGRLGASLMFVPVKSGGEVTGLLVAQSYAADRYGPEDLEVFERFADVVAPALERVRVENELRRSETKYRSLVERIPAMTYTAQIDEASTTIYVSPQVEGILGYTPVEYQGDSDMWRKRLHPDDRARVLGDVGRCYATGSPLACEYRMLARDGRVVWLRDEGAIIRDEAGQAVCLQGVMFDITERKRAEEALRLQAELAGALVAATTLSEALGHVLDAALRMDGIDCGGIYSVHEVTGDVALVSHKGLSSRFVEVVSHFCADSPQTRLVMAGRPVYLALEELDKGHEACIPEGMHALAVLPVPYEGRVIAVLNVASRSCDEIPVAFRNVFETVLVQAGFAIDRIRSREALQRARDELEQHVAERTAELRAANEQLRREVADRKQAEGALRVSEAQYRAVVDDQTELISRWRPDGTLIFVNEAARRYSGKSREEVVGRGFLEYILPEDRDYVAAQLAHWRTVLTPEDPTMTIEHRVIHASGQVRWVQWTNRAVFDDQGCLTGFQAVGRDVTEYRQAEAALRESEARYRTLAEAANDCIYIIDRDDRVEYVNSFAARQFGARPEELIGRPRSELFPPVLAERQKRSLDKVFQTGEPLGAEDVIVFPGRLTWQHTQLVPLRDADGTVAKVLGISRDITSIRQTADALRESEERHRIILDQMEEAVVFADAEHIIRDINACACELLGTTRKKAIGQEVVAMHADRMRPRIEEILRSFREGGNLHVVTVRTTFGGRELIFRISPARGSDGSYRGVIAAIVDITEQMKVQQQLAEAQKLETVGRLAGGIAHDFNNLMQTVLGTASRLRARCAPDHPNYSALAQVEQAADTAGRLAHQLLVYAKGGKILPRLVDFAEVVARAMDIVRPTVPAGVVLDYQIVDGLGKVECDIARTEQAIVNLCRNAIDAMAQGGRLTVRADNTTLTSVLEDSHPLLHAGEYVRVAVGDTGSGVAPEALNHLFDPFFTTKPQGHGLGLAAAYGTVKAHGGAISVKTRLGEGATFQIWLPRVRTEKA